MTEQQCAVTHPEINQVVPVDAAFACPLGSFHNERKGRRRAAIARGCPEREAVRPLLAPAVWDYIAAHRLYAA